MGLSVSIGREAGGFRLHVEFEAGKAPLALLGVSGSGKTMALRCIAGLDRPSRGRIALDGEVLYDSERGVSLSPQARRIGFLPRHSALFPDMTVRQNVAAGVWDRRNVERVVEEKLYHCHLESVSEKRPRDLTPPQRLRTAAARLLASDPYVILLDAPLSGAEGAEQFELEMDLSDLLWNFDGPIVWATADQSVAYRNCRYVCVLDQGQTQEKITTSSLVAFPGTEAAARLSGCGNFADAIPRESAVYLPQWGVTLRCAYPLPPFLWRVGIHARNVRLSNPGMVNAFAVEVDRNVEDVSATIVLLRPVGAADDAPLLRMELDKTDWQAVPDKKRLTVSVSPQDILLLK